jgi:hypothetical protein
MPPKIKSILISSDPAALQLPTHVQMHPLVGSIVLGAAWPTLSRSMPRASHHTESRLKPRIALLLAKAGRCRCESPRKPVLFEEILKTRPDHLGATTSTARNSNNMRLCSSRTVRGSTRFPPSPTHQPLKSTVQTSLQLVAFLPLDSLPLSVALRVLRGLVSPARSRMRLKLLSLGVAPGWRRHRDPGSCAVPSGGAPV